MENKVKILKAAAKAAGIVYDTFWDPLVSDSDAIALMSRLRISLDMDAVTNDGRLGIDAWFVDIGGYVYSTTVPYTDDIEEDIRTAITLCAAQIGEYR